MESEDVCMFFQGDLPSESFAVFRDLKLKKQLCDVRIIVNDRSFLVHRVVLAAVIPYFRVMFTSDRIESKARKLDLKIVAADALEALIDFAYCSKITITKENARPLLFASVFLKMRQIQNVCCSFLEKNLDLHNVMDIRSLADSLICKTLVENCDLYIRRNFDEFAVSSSFLDLPVQYLKKLVSRDDLQVTCEERVCEAVLRWVKFSSTERGTHLSELLRSIRICHLPAEYLVTRVSSEAVIRSSTAFQDLVEQTKYYHLLPNHEALHSTLNTQPRSHNKPIIQGATMHSYSSDIYCISYSDTLGCIVQYFDEEKTQWITAATNDRCRNVAKVVAVDFHIYVSTDQSMEALDLKTMKWATLASCPFVTVGSGFVSHSQQIYCFDGSPGKSVWCYDELRSKWFTRGSTLMQRSRAGLVSLGQYIYLSGGLYSECDLTTIHDSLERYDPQTKQTTTLSPMLSKRWGHGSAAMNGKIYACGGHCGDGFLSSRSEAYDCQQDQWISIKSMAYPRFPFYLVSHSERLYAIGGRTKSGRTLTVEIYDPRKNEWEFGDPVPTKDVCEEIKGAMVISKTRMVREDASRRKLNKTRADQPAAAQKKNLSRQSSQRFSKYDHT